MAFVLKFRPSVKSGVADAAGGVETATHSGARGDDRPHERRRESASQIDSSRDPADDDQSDHDQSDHDQSDHDQSSDRPYLESQRGGQDDGERMERAPGPSSGNHPNAADSARDVSGLAGFNLDDLADQGREHLELTRQTVRKMIADAQQQAKQIHADARREGYAEGKQAAEADIAAKINAAAIDQSARAVTTLTQTVSAMHQQYETWMQRYAELLNQSIVRATERILRKKLSDEPELIVRWAAEALATTRASTSLSVAVHPETLAELGTSLSDIIQSHQLPEQTDIRPDESVSQTEVSVRQTGGQIDAGLMAQLDRLTELLENSR